MNAEKHIIRQQILNVNSKFELPQSVERTIQQIYHGQIIALFDKIFSEYAPAGTNIKINKLVLDIGNIRVNSLETDLLQSVETQLRKYFSQHIFLDDGYVKQIEIGKEQKIKLLRQFFNTGNFSKNIYRAEVKSIEKVAEELLEKKPRKLIALLNEFVDHPYFIFFRRSLGDPILSFCVPKGVISIAIDSSALIQNLLLPQRHSETIRRPETGVLILHGKQYV